MKTDVLFSSATDLWETPRNFFDELNAEFHFTVDVCATPENAKCARYFTPEQDGLRQKWGGHGMVQSSLRKNDRPVGAEGLLGGAGRGHRGYAPARQNGHAVVP